MHLLHTYMYRVLIERYRLSVYAVQLYFRGVSWLVFFALSGLQSHFALSGLQSHYNFALSRSACWEITIVLSKQDGP